MNELNTNAKCIEFLQFSPGCGDVGPQVRHCVGVIQLDNQSGAISQPHLGQGLPGDQCTMGN